MASPSREAEQTSCLLIPLRSPAGQRMLSECDDTVVPNAHNLPARHDLIRAWRRQRGACLCGPASVAIALTSTAAATTSSGFEQTFVDDSWPRYDLDVPVNSSDSAGVRVTDHVSVGGEGWVDEEDVLAAASETTAVSAGLQKSVGSIRARGVTLQELEILAMTATMSRNGGGGAAVVQRFHVVDARMNERRTKRKLASIGSIVEMRSTIVNSLRGSLSSLDEADDSTLLSGKKNNSVVILNYHMTKLGQPPLGGHFSPVAAYHAGTDSVLIMDTWYRTEPVWAPLAVLYSACQAVDPESNLPRGLLLIDFGCEAGGESNRRRDEMD